MENRSLDTATATVFNIQKFCTDDGPGIRTTVFLKGCHLHCAWCHNPEGLSSLPVLEYSAVDCVSCRRCESICPNTVHSFADGTHHIDRARCTRCGACAHRCPAQAISLQEGKDHCTCRTWLLQMSERYAPRYGCGLCQTGVPCEHKNPSRRG